MIFKFYIGGYPGPFYNLEVIGNVLKCTETLGHEIESRAEIIVLEGNAEWQEVLCFLSTRKWKKEYLNDCLDGTQWELCLQGNSISINSHGSNVYPPGFRKFLRLLNIVVFEVGMDVR